MTPANPYAWLWFVEGLGMAYGPERPTISQGLPFPFIVLCPTCGEVWAGCTPGKDTPHRNWVALTRRCECCGNGSLFGLDWNCADGLSTLPSPFLRRELELAISTHTTYNSILQ